MLKYKADYTYMISGGVELFTTILLPDLTGKFPVVIIRDPYVDRYENEEEENIVVEYLSEYKNWLKRGYTMVIQHCRGRGKSGGDCIPYINEREDGLALQSWIRKQEFYNGEIFLKGASYLTSSHYITAPFADDIKGAVFGIQDTEKYNICYRNGFLKKGLFGAWYVGMYKAKSHMRKNCTRDFGAFDLLPLKDFTKTVFKEAVEDYDAVLKAPKPTDEFWNTRFGGSDERNATDNAPFPMLLTTGFYDLYTGGVFDMWNRMSEESRNKSALVVSPYDHNDGCDTENSILFENGKREEQFGRNYEIEWFEYVCGKIKKSPFATGKVTYYRLFENKWATDDFAPVSNTMEIKLGESEVSYVYNPYDAPRFKGGLSRAFGGTVFQDEPNSRYDIISVYSEPFEKGEKLRVDIASADNEHYVRHTNNKGLYSEQTTAKIANNTIFLQESFLTLPVDD